MLQCGFSGAAIVLAAGSEGQIVLGGGREVIVVVRALEHHSLEGKNCYEVMSLRGTSASLSGGGSLREVIAIDSLRDRPDALKD